MPETFWTWGSTAEERGYAFPCDSLIDRADAALFRAVSVDASPASVFRWLCQLRIAPYSYDWIDNYGRRSPQQLTLGLDRLAPGQPVMRIFELTSFSEPEQITIVLRRGRRLFGELAATYLVVPEGDDRCRIVVKLVVRWPRPRPWGLLVRALLPGGDMVMMRRQLLNFKALAEAEAGPVGANG